MDNANDGMVTVVDKLALMQGGEMVAIVTDPAQAPLIAAALNIGLMAMQAASKVKRPTRKASPAETKLKTKLRKTAKVIDGLTKNGTPRKRAPRTCGICGEEGHDKRNCEYAE